MTSRILLLQLLLSYTAFGQADKISLDHFPDLNKKWTPYDYSLVLLELKNSKDNGIPLPRISDSYYSEFYNRLFSTDNLELFVDPEINPKERARLVSPYFEILPDYISYFLENDQTDESLLSLRFMIEATISMTHLFSDLLKCETANKREQFYQDQLEKKSVFHILNGTLEILHDPMLKKNANPKYVELLMDCVYENTPELISWISSTDLADYKSKIIDISRKHYLNSVQNQAKDLIDIVNNFKPSLQFNINEISKSSIISIESFKNDVLGIKLDFPKEWTIKDFEKTQNNDNELTEFESENTVYLLYLEKQNEDKKLRPSLLLSLENIECSKIKTSEDYAKQIIENLKQINLDYKIGEIQTTTFKGMNQVTLTLTLGSLTQEISILTLLNKYVLVFTLNYFNNTDRSSMTKIQESLSFKNAR